MGPQQAKPSQVPAAKGRQSIHAQRPAQALPLCLLGKPFYLSEHWGPQSHLDSNDALLQGVMERNAHEDPSTRQRMTQMWSCIIGVGRRGGATVAQKQRFRGYWDEPARFAGENQTCPWAGWGHRLQSIASGQASVPWARTDHSRYCWEWKEWNPQPTGSHELFPVLCSVLLCV